MLHLVAVLGGPTLPRAILRASLSLSPLLRRRYGHVGSYGYAGLYGHISPYGAYAHVPGYRGQRAWGYPLRCSCQSVLGRTATEESLLASLHDAGKSGKKP